MGLGYSRVLKRICCCAADDGFADGRAHLLADRYERLADCRPDGLSNAAADDRAQRGCTPFHVLRIGLRAWIAL